MSSSVSQYESNMSGYQYGTPILPSTPENISNYLFSNSLPTTPVLSSVPSFHHHITNNENDQISMTPNQLEIPSLANSPFLSSFPGYYYSTPSIDSFSPHNLAPPFSLSGSYSPQYVMPTVNPYPPPPVSVSQKVLQPKEKAKPLAFLNSTEMSIKRATSGKKEKGKKDKGKSDVQREVAVKEWMEIKDELQRYFSDFQSNGPFASSRDFILQPISEFLKGKIDFTSFLAKIKSLSIPNNNGADETQNLYHYLLPKFLSCANLLLPSSNPAVKEISKKRKGAEVDGVTTMVNYLVEHGVSRNEMGLPDLEIGKESILERDESMGAMTEFTVETSSFRNQELDEEIDEEKDDDMDADVDDASMDANKLALERKRESTSKGLRSPPNKWTKEESQKLIKLVQIHGERQWKKIAEQLSGGKTGAQCAQHWKRVLSPEIRKGSWDDQEEELLFSLVRKHGQSWKNIATEIKTRTDIQCRYQYLKACMSRDVLWSYQEDEILMKKVQQLSMDLPSNKKSNSSNHSNSSNTSNTGNKESNANSEASTPSPTIVNSPSNSNNNNNNNTNNNNNNSSNSTNQSQSQSQSQSSSPSQSPSNPNPPPINWVEVAKALARAKITKIPRTALECKHRWINLPANPSPNSQNQTAPSQFVQGTPFFSSINPLISSLPAQSPQQQYQFHIAQPHQFLQAQSSRGKLSTPVTPLSMNLDRNIY